MSQNLCFVLMPFGRKAARSGRSIDFDAVYSELIQPAIQQAGMEPLRANEEQGGGIIHKPMYERLILCDYAVADLTTANANVFYELGLRHAVRASSTVLLYAEGEADLPFDVKPLRYLPYALDVGGEPARKGPDRTALAARLDEARRGLTDSPVYQLVEGFPDIEHIKTDVFRDRVAYSAVTKERLADARRRGVDAVRDFERTQRPIESAEAGVVIDLLLSYRALKAWDDMIALVPAMTRPLAATRMVQEQLAFAYNRVGRWQEAEATLRRVLDERGASSETYGILGRVYKDRWETAFNAGESFTAAGFLTQAVDAYLKGVEADWRDAYPGVNAVTLMEIQEPPDPRREKLLPIVAYAVERRIARGQTDYWDFATQLELAVLGRDETTALAALGQALARVRESWEPETTARNLRLIREARERRGDALEWPRKAEQELTRRAAKR